MDSLTNISLVITTLLCLLAAVSPTAASPLGPNVTLLQTACNNTVDPEFCLSYLSKNAVVSASQNAPLPLAAAITESGLTYAQQMRDYSSNKIARSPVVKTAYAECAKLLDGSATNLKLALNILKHPEELAQAGASEDASESLMTSIDGVTGCSQKLASVKVEDQYVEMSSKHVKVHSAAANSILTDLKVNGEKMN